MTSLKSAQSSGPRSIRNAIRPMVPRPMRGIRRLGVTAFTSPHTRRLLPIGLTVRPAEAIGSRAERTQTRRWEDSRDFHRELLKHTPLAGSEGDVARRAITVFFT